MRKRNTEKSKPNHPAKRGRERRKRRGRDRKEGDKGRRKIQREERKKTIIR